MSRSYIGATYVETPSHYQLQMATQDIVTIQNTIIVPAAALLNSDDGGQKVMVIDKDSVAHERKVVPAVRQGERVQIVTGLQEGEQVVTSGGLGLEDKAKVTIQKPKSEDDEDDDADAKDDKGK